MGASQRRVDAAAAVHFWGMKRRNAREWRLAAMSSERGLILDVRLAGDDQAVFHTRPHWDRRGA